MWILTPVKSTTRDFCQISATWFQISQSCTEASATSFPRPFLVGPLQTLEIKSLPYTRQPTSSMETLLTLHQDPWESQFELLFSFFHLLLVGCLLIDEPADVAVGRLDHGVEVVGSSPVHFPTFYPGQQGLDGFWELGVICSKKGQLYTTNLGWPGQLSGLFPEAKLPLQRSASFRWLITTPGSREGSEHVGVRRKVSPAPSWWSKSPAEVQRDDEQALETY